MEFYFGNSNLSQDKYFLKLISKDHKGYVDIKEFLSFNKIKKILIDKKLL